MKRNFVCLITVCLIFLIGLVSFQSSALAQTTPSRLTPGQSIGVGGSLKSQDGRYTFILQSDRNLVLYRNGSLPALWATGTNGSDARNAVLQGDGNFVLYGASRALWASGTNGQRIAYLVMQNDGNLVLYRPDGSAAWATGTNEPPPRPPSPPTSQKCYSCTVFRANGTRLVSRDIRASNRVEASGQCGRVMSDYGGSGFSLGSAGSC